MNFKTFIINQFDEIISRLDQLGGKIDTGRQSITSPKTYSTNETAEILGVSTRTLSTYRKNRQIGFVQIGRKILYTKSHLDAFLGSYKVESFTSKTKPYGKH